MPAAVSLLRVKFNRMEVRQSVSLMIAVFAVIAENVSSYMNKIMNGCEIM